MSARSPRLVKSESGSFSIDDFARAGVEWDRVPNYQARNLMPDGTALLVRSRLSVQPVSPERFDLIVSLAGS